MKKRLFRHHLIIILVLLAGCGTIGEGVAKGSAEPAVDFDVAIRKEGAGRAEVRMRLYDLPPRETTLQLEMKERFAFITLEEPLLEDGPRAWSPEGGPLSMTRRDAYHWTLDSEGRREIFVAYTVPLTHQSLPEVASRDANEWPYLDEDHGILVAGTLFMAPRNLDLKEVRVSFDLPEGWEILSPWSPSGEGAFLPKDQRELFDDLFAIGNWSLRKVDVPGMEITLAFAPAQEALERAAAPVIEKIVRAEVELFGMIPRSRYNFLFVKSRMRHLAGSPKTGSMTLSVPPLHKGESIEKHLGHLIAHEFHHLWSATRYQCPEALRFFNEGFTDYYAYLVQAREGIITREEFGGTLARFMRDCYGNDHRGKMSLAEAGGRAFFTDQQASDLVYKGGCLAAALLDGRIRRTLPQKNLDHFMRDFNNDPRWSLGGEAPSIEDFLERVEQYLGEAQAEEFRDLITEPYDPDFVEAFKETDTEVTLKVGKAKPSLRGNLNGVKLLDLDPAGLAYRLGIRPGDRFLEINGKKPSQRREVYLAWSRPVDGRIQARIDRKGEEIHIDEPLPEEAVYRVNTPYP